MMLSGEYNRLPHAGYRLMPEVAREILPRRFRLAFDNSRRHGTFPIEAHVTFGCAFPDGLVAIGTHAFGRVGFESMAEMKEVMGRYGEVQVDYIDD